MNKPCVNRTDYAWRRLLVFGAIGIVLVAVPAHAYLGPGAGFALVSSFLVMLTTIVIALLSLLAYPFRMLWRLLLRKRISKPWIRRLIVVGFDGQDPKLTDRYMQMGKLPNFERLAQSGCYHRLRTTFPALSPVAWSSFSTGTNPAGHNIFDFLDRDLRTYLPRLSSARIGRLERTLKLGRYRIPLRKPEIRLLRKSKPFWSYLGEHDIWSTILRVPITFPPDRFHGAQLSAMCTPDLLGTQGTFALYTTRKEAPEFKEGGIRIRLEPNGHSFRTSLKGPENSLVEGNPTLEIPMSIELDRSLQQAQVQIGNQSLVLREGHLSDWVTVKFRAAPFAKVSGLCRLMVTEMAQDFSLYVSPISMDPEDPAMPISHPDYYATYLAKKIGPFATLGLAEDTWALNEGVTDEATFLKQAYDIDRERQDMFFSALDRLKSGALVCVFDATDRIQHMFWRYLEEDHPASANSDRAQHQNAIENIYQSNDRLLAKIADRIEPGDLLFVISDHGFSSFQRGVNLNRWLLDNGYLSLKKGSDGRSEWLRDVDWAHTRAYCMGLTGLYLNVRGRETNGIVSRGREVRQLKAEIVGRLRGLKDDTRGKTAVTDVFDTDRIYRGPYLDNAPDLLVGYNAGYRVSWDCASGMAAGPVFEDNCKAWSGDHCIDPRMVPGVLFCNRKIDAADPSLIDLAPTALRLFGLDPPGHMEGKPLFESQSFSGEEV